ncbi:MAG: hypothetical protein JST86_03810 [Bacteroidetes bacterium]|nr:hypothetical protein [Bacteroidota bacterium]
MQKVAANLKQQHSTKEFIEDFVKKEGFPVWNKALITSGGSGNGSVIAAKGSTTTTVTVIIPLVEEGANYVHGYLCAKETGDLVDVQLHRNSDYLKLPYSGSKGDDGIATTAETYATRMMQLDNLVFGYEKFEVKDRQLFSGGKANSGKDSMQRFVELKPAANGNTSSIASVNSYVYTTCVTITTITYSVSHYCGTPEYCHQHYPPNGCDYCGTYCHDVYTPSYSTSSECYSWEEEEGGSGIPWPVPAPGGGGGSGGGNTPPCPLIINLVSSVVPANCNPVPNPWPVLTLPPTPNPNNDSIVKALLKKDNEDIKRIRDSVWNLAYANDEEWGFFIKNVNGQTNVLGLRTDHDPDGVTQDRFVENNNPDGDWHCHQDHPSSGYRHPHDPQDIALGNGRNRRLYFRSYVDCGDTLYAVVNENLALIKLYFQTKNFRQIEESTTWTQIAGAGANRRSLGLQALLELLGSSSVSGLGLYKSVNADKTEFVKVN